MYLTWPAKCTPSLSMHLFQRPVTSLSNVKVQFAEHPLAEAGAKLVALLNKTVVGTKALLVEGAIAASVIDIEGAEVCGCAGGFAVIDTNAMSVDTFMVLHYI